MDKLPKTWTIRQKGKWIKDNFEEIDKLVKEVGKAETARILDIYVGSLYNLYTKRKNPNYGTKKLGRPKKIIEPFILNMQSVSLTTSEKKAQAILEKSKKTQLRRGSKKSPLKAIDTLLKSSKGPTFNNSLVQSIVTILEDYSKTKLELKCREEQSTILLEKIKKLEIELLRYRENSSREVKIEMSKVLEKAKSSLITYGD
jgi:hypothetical protein